MRAVLGLLLAAMFPELGGFGVEFLTGILSGLRARVVSWIRR